MGVEGDSLYEAKYAVDLLWRIRSGELAHDDEIERAAHGVQSIIDAVERGIAPNHIEYVPLGIDKEGT